MAFLALVAGPRLAPGPGDDPAAPHLHHRAPPSLHPHQVGQLLVSTTIKGEYCVLLFDGHLVWPGSGTLLHPLCPALRVVLLYVLVFDVEAAFGLVTGTSQWYKT